MGREVPFPSMKAAAISTDAMGNFISDFKKLPRPQACRLIDFERAKIVRGIIEDTWFLIVGGKKPWLAMKMSLNPVVYVRRPKYWRIDVVGCLDGISAPVMGPYLVDRQLTPGDGMGTKGVELFGAGKSKKLKIP